MRPYDTIIQNKKTIITIYITSQQRYRNGNIHIKFEFENCESVCEILLLRPDEMRLDLSEFVFLFPSLC